MILEAGKANAIWGHAPPYTRVSVQLRRVTGQDEAPPPMNTGAFLPALRRSKTGLSASIPHCAQSVPLSAPLRDFRSYPLREAAGLWGNRARPKGRRRGTSPKKPFSQTAGAAAQTRAGSGGNWQLYLPPVPAGGPFRLIVRAGRLALTIDDVYAGELWLCAGQSNMELPMARLKDAFPNEYIPPLNSLIRQFTVPAAYDFSARKEDLAAESFDGAPASLWMSASPETLDRFSGTAWFFARRRFEARNVPIGIVLAAVGGSPVSAWMSAEDLRRFPRLFKEGARYADDTFRARTIAQNTRRQAAWEDALRAADRGLAGRWETSPGGEGTPLPLPGGFAALPELAGFCGALWLTRRVTVDPARAGLAARLLLGTIVDADTAFVNGVKVGETGYRYPPRKYAIPAGLLCAGENTITLRVVCANGEGGVTPDKPFRLCFGPPGAAAPVELGGLWRCRVGARAPRRENGFFIQWQPGGLFNAMIAPLTRCVFRGVLWYQGESDDTAPGEYAALFAALITGWRRDFGDPALPFIFTQLPLWGTPEAFRAESPWAALREAQRQTLALPQTGMACALDLGEWNDLHPLNKEAAGFRLALAARAVVDGVPSTAPGAALRTLTRRGDSLLLDFDRAGTGLRMNGQALITVIDGVGVAHSLFPHIEGPAMLSASLAGIPAPRRVFYAWADNPLGAALYNSDGLPALPFQANIPPA